MGLDEMTSLNISGEGAARRSIQVFAFACIFARVACAPDPVLTANGPYKTDGANPSQYKRFFDAYLTAAALPARSILSTVALPVPNR